MEFIVMVKATVTVEKVILSDTWEGAIEKAKKVRIVDVIPTPKSFSYVDTSDTEITGILLNE